ncbi:diphosphate--fructose-6-phosphate 1-phosphotransferase [Terriglobus sp. RCC_193]|uniref:diphosphate--fructose-6-phosphate 1-phosphotransferase n=1 Tax=Terriglobus sp. RCC_193 TaxID=3239218 RepID=UPI003525E154
MHSDGLMIVQGGGPTAVFNASLAGIVREAQQLRFSSIYGARFGMKGLSSGDVISLTSLTPDALEGIRLSPGAALGTSRFKPTEEDLDHCIHVLQSHGISRMIFLGGNGTMGGAHRFLEFCASRGFSLQVMGAPKTIDNDIRATDRCPGFGSAARYVAQSLLDLSMDLQSLPQPVSIMETLGRDVGWLAAASMLAKQHPDEAPHVVCIPEIPFVLDNFLQRIDATVKRIGWAVAVVSEGTSYADGTPVFEQVPSSGGKIPMRPLIGGVAQHLSGLVAEHLGLRCRSEKPGLIARSASPYVSAQDRADAELTGRECVRALAAGTSGFMVSLRAIGSNPAFELLPLTEAAGPRRAIPQEWLRHDGLAVNDAFLQYARPIVGPLQRHPASLSGHPVQ